jgi:3'-phosphoadenosine 5'-phosphosulfate sulfotransferase (PAPS reductase)/FAD synthetase
MSFYAAYLSIHKYGKENVLLYFNDTNWEHPDLYRFLEDIRTFLDKDIFTDSDGRSPEQVFYDNKFLGNNRVPLCSRILKAERLQEYYKDGDNIIFGIGLEEMHRVHRIVSVYQIVSAKKQKFCTVEFPLIDKKLSKYKIDEWFAHTGIALPELYRLGFEHNNCSGGCVRQGKKQWRKLLHALPDVYAGRERLENSFRESSGKDVSFLKDTTLEELRNQEDDYESEPTLFSLECVGICNTMN